MTRYLAGLSVAGLSLCVGGWLIVTVTALGRGSGDAGRVNLATGAGLALVGCVTAVAWAAAWRRRLRADGVLAVSARPAGRISPVPPMSPVSPREARRNRRQLARDVRRAARLSKRMTREQRPGGAQQAPWNGEHLGDGWHPVFGSPARERAAAGYDGASAADLLGELRTLLGPLLAAAASAQPPASAQPSSAQPSSAQPASAQPPCAQPPASASAQPATAPAPRETKPRPQALPVWPADPWSAGPWSAGPWSAGPWPADSEEAWW